MSWNYQNNMANTPNLRDVIREETRKCMEDPIYFMRKYVKIQHPNKGTIPFNLFPFQEDALQHFHDNRFLLILKSRQLGITTLVAAYSLWLSIFNSDKSILIISIKQEVSKEIVTKVRFANEHLPSWLKVKETTNNHMSLRFENGSQVAATSSSKDAGRSKALSLLIIDEAAFIDEAHDIWTSCYNTLSTGGRAIVLSTPNGVGNWFHNMWVNAEKKRNDFKTLKLPWTLHPERDQNWRDEQTKQLGAKGANQECFDGDTRIYTRDGLKPIKDVNVNDFVLTDKGEYKRVIRKINNGVQNTTGFFSSLNKKMSYVTDNHPFINISEKWIDFKNIKNNDLLLAFPNVNFESTKVPPIDLSKLKINTNFKISTEKDKCFINDRRHKTKHNRFIDFDYDLGYFVGLYLAEGWKENGRTYLCFNYKTELNDWVVKIIDILEKKFGITNFSIRKDKTYNSGQLMINSTIISSLLDFLTEGKDCYTKKLSPSSYVHSFNYYMGIIDGCFLGDGMVLKKYNKQFSTRSDMLFYDIKYLCSICGFSLNSQIARNFKNKSYNTCYILSLLKTKHIECKNRLLSSILNKNLISNYWKSSHGFVNDKIYSKIYKTDKKIKKEVYNLEVEDHHTYVTEHFIAHNCDCDFLSSGTNVIDLMTLKWYEEEPGMIIDRIENQRGEEWWIFKKPEDGHNYIISADVARGDGLDNSAAHVIDIDTLEQCGEYYGQLSTKDFGDELVVMATRYNDALLIVEYTGIGVGVLQRVIDKEYKNTFYSSLDLKVVEVHRQMTNKHHAEDRKLKPGFSTTISTRPVIISKLEAYFREKAVTVHSSRLIQELKTFIWENGKAQAAENYNDDLVMAMGIGLWVRDTALRLRKDGILLTKTMLDKIHVNQNNEKVPIYTARAASNGRESWQMKTGGKPGDIESLTWLLR